MNIIISVLRRERHSPERIWQSFEYIGFKDEDTVASALININSREDLKDVNGDPAEKIEWECSCLQKKCGACAMVICGKPRLACGALLSEFKNGIIKLEPLRKFPVVRDLVSDRSILFENLKTLQLWLKNDAELSDHYRELAYESSECIQCGCCLEICPNFYAGGSFFGMAPVPLTARLLTEMSPSEYRGIAKQYVKHSFNGCSRSLACRNVCPKKIDVEKLLVNVNALAVWKRKKKRIKP